MSNKPSPCLYRLADLIEDGLFEATKAHEAYKTQTARGPQIELSPRLQHDIGGFLPVGLTVLHGPPGSAKTALANQIAGTCGFSAMIVTCEMSPLELLHRHASPYALADSRGRRCPRHRSVPR